MLPQSTTQTSSSSTMTWSLLKCSPCSTRLSKQDATLRFSLSSCQALTYQIGLSQQLTTLKSADKTLSRLLPRNRTWLSSWRRKSSRLRLLKMSLLTRQLLKLMLAWPSQRQRCSLSLRLRSRRLMLTRCWRRNLTWTRLSSWTSWGVQLSVSTAKTTW